MPPTRVLLLRSIVDFSLLRIYDPLIFSFWFITFICENGYRLSSLVASTISYALGKDGSCWLPYILGSKFSATWECLFLSLLFIWSLVTSEGIRSIYRYWRFWLRLKFSKLALSWLTSRDLLWSKRGGEAVASLETARECPRSRCQLGIFAGTFWRFSMVDSRGLNDAGLSCWRGRNLWGAK